jgi:hypothetical protein
MFELGRVDNIMMRSKEGEDDGEDDSDTDGGAEGSPEGIDLELIAMGC